MSKKIFDYQLVRIIECHHKQPDLKYMVRLFFNLLPDWTGFLLNKKNYFNVFHVRESEALLGSNKNRYEIRLYFYKTGESTERIILCLAISYFDLIGFAQTLYIRVVFWILLPSVIALMENSLREP